MFSSPSLVSGSLQVLCSFLGVQLVPCLGQAFQLQASGPGRFSRLSAALLAFRSSGWFGCVPRFGSWPVVRLPFSHWSYLP